MHKKIILFISLIFSINISFGFTCDGSGNPVDNTSKSPVCDQTPKIIEQYLEDEISLINLFKNSLNKSSDVEGLGSRALNTPIGTYKVTEQIFSTFGTDFFSNFKAIFEDKSINRDRQKLLNLKPYISSTILNSVKNKSLDTTIDKETIDKINELTKSKDSFVLKYKGTTYQEAYNYIWTNHQAIEDIYYNSIIKGKKEDYKISNSKYQIDNQHFENFKNKLVSSYFDKDGAKPTCNTNWDSFLKALKEVVCTYGKQKTDKAIDRFECNYKRLRNALFGEQNDANCGNAQLAPMIPLKDRIKVNGKGKIMKMAKDFREFIGKLADIPTNLSKTFESKKVDTIAQIQSQQEPEEIPKNIMITEIYNSVKNIDLVKQETTKSLTNIEPGDFTHGITKQFPQISKNIHDTIEEINGHNENYNESGAGQTSEACKKTPPSVGECKKTKQ